MIYDSLFSMFERLLLLQRQSADEQIGLTEKENLERKALYSYFEQIIKGLDDKE